MKKKLVLIILALCLFTTGCGEKASSKIVNMGDSMVQIEDEDCLFYRKDTKVVYIVMAQQNNPGCSQGTGYGYMAPYISENGCFCIYSDGEIKEIK